MQPIWSELWGLSTIYVNVRNKSLAWIIMAHQITHVQFWSQSSFYFLTQKQSFFQRTI